jgi:hypothetical protein
VFNKLLAIGGILVIVGGLFLLVNPVTHIPLLDANRAVLAESDADGFCAGQTFMKTRGYGNEAQMNECLDLTKHSKDINHMQVQPAFCAGLKDAGLDMGKEECMGILNENKLWPTMTGGLSSSWNRRFPYPGDFLTSNVPQTGGDSRTGDRETNDREGNIR